jgi:glycosyltransferase involved in cell wall biosynthesis
MNRSTHCVVIPAFNPGNLLEPTLRGVLEVWRPVFLVLDGSTDGSRDVASKLAANDPGLSVVERPENGGKGAAVLDGFERAANAGFTHAAVFDSDGQHDAGDLPKFMDASRAYPDAMILGAPLFGPDAPGVRVYGRLFGNYFTHLETLWGGIEDSLFGLRVYPIEPSIRILKSIQRGRGFDFDTQLAVRLYWEGVRPLNIPTRVVYRQRNESVSHFHYLRDNLLLVGAHANLLSRFFAVAPRLLRYRRRARLSWP